MGSIHRLACRIVGHRYVKFADGLKRRCSRCRREEWVFSRPYTLVGEPKYIWRFMYYAPTSEGEQR